MATGPKLPETPLEVLNSPPLSEPLFWNKFWGGGIGAIVCFGGVLFGNWASRKPILSGFQKHVIATAAGAYLGNLVDGYRDDYYAEKDAVLRHYVQLHPEDFPPYRRTKYADLLEPWYPIR